MAHAISDPQAERYFRRRAGLPAPDADQRHGWRVLVSPLNIITLLMTVMFAAILGFMYWGQLEVKRPDGLQDPSGHTPRAIALAFQAALPTLLVLTAAFVMVDRWRPVKWQLWWMALGWGAAVATFASMHLNTWVAALMGGGGERSAIYSAPFVEELTKGTIIFVLAMAFRYRLLTTTNVVLLGLMSAVGFAFVENILYYVRAYTFSRNEISVGNPDEALQSLAHARGVLTAWGHPSFTFYTAMGMALGLKARSKSVRILAPVSGFLVAAMLHMFFNFQASVGSPQEIMFAVIGASVAFSFLVFVVVRWFSEATLIRQRLREYVRMGWLPPEDIRTYGTIKAGIAMLLKSFLRGPRTLMATVRLTRRFTELAYLRELMVRGVIDVAGQHRERELLNAIEGLRSGALGDPRGQPWITWWRRRRRTASFPPPAFPGPAGIGGNWPAPTTQGLPSQYSASDSTGGSPRG